MARKTATPKPVQQYHYFGSTAYDWMCGDTQSEVLKRLSYWGDGIKAAKKNGRPGMEAVIVRVELPQSATYTIRNYVPHKITKPNADGELVATDELVPLGPVERLYLTSTRGDTVPRNIED